MKKLFIFLALLSSTLVAASCSDAHDEIVETQVSELSGIEEKIAKGLAIISENADNEFETGGYIVYSAEDNDYVVVNDYIYGMGTIINEWFKGEVSDTTISTISLPAKAPKGNGWKYGGRCKNTLQQLSLAKKISKLIPAGKNFEIHAEYEQKTGYYKVWYRVVN